MNLILTPYYLIRRLIRNWLMVFYVISPSPREVMERELADSRKKIEQHKVEIDLRELEYVNYVESHQAMIHRHEARVRRLEKQLTALDAPKPKKARKAPLTLIDEVAPVRKLAS